MSTNQKDSINTKKLQIVFKFNKKNTIFATEITNNKNKKRESIIRPS